MACRPVYAIITARSLILSGLYASHQHAGLKLHISTVDSTAFLPLIESTPHKKTCDTAARLTSQHHHTWNDESRNCQTAGILSPIAWRLKAFIAPETKFLCYRLELCLLSLSRTQHRQMTCSEWNSPRTTIRRFLQPPQESRIEKLPAQLIYKSFLTLWNANKIPPTLRRRIVNAHAISTLRLRGHLIPRRHCRRSYWALKSSKCPHQVRRRKVNIKWWFWKQRTVLFRYLWTYRPRREFKTRSEREMSLPLTVSVSAEKSEIGRLLRRLPHWSSNYAMQLRREIITFKRETISRM